MTTTFSDFCDVSRKIEKYLVNSKFLSILAIAGFHMTSLNFKLQKY